VTCCCDAARLTEAPEAQTPQILATPDGPRADQTGAAVLIELLVRYEELALLAGVPMEATLRPGISEDQVRSVLGEVGLTPPTELVAWFGWHNGCADSGQAGLALRTFPNFVMAGAEEAAANYRTGILEYFPPWLPPETELSAERGDIFGIGEGWLMLTGSNRGYAIECTERDGPSPRIRYANEQFGEPGTENFFRAVSLCTIVTWWIEAFDNGAYRWNRERLMWDFDPLQLPSLLPDSQQAAHFA
jgi:hypothetical protein